jgi:hypothetical protein
MSLKQRLTTAVIATATLTAQSTTIIGNVRDAETGEALIGVAIAVSNTTKGAASDLDGNYSLGNLGAGTYTLRASYLSYETQEQTITLGKEQTATLDWRMTPQSTRLNEVTIAAKKQLDNERSLMNERKNSTLAIENIGARELSAKGISNAEEGVKKITGVSIADAGQLIVRGLGDRYSTTTLNTLPIASPNPDKKLIPLNLFPSSTIQNITVSKVYDPEYYADYSGAHVDISTKENTGKDFLNIGLNIGGNSITTLRETLQMDRDGSQLKTPSLEDKIRDMKKSDFREYIKSKNIFSTDFSVRKKRALPNLGGSISGGKSFRFGRSSLDLMGAVNIENSNQTNNNGIVRILEATGNTLSEFEYDSYKEALKTTGLGNITYSFRGTDRIGYTILYSRERDDTYILREGYDEEGIELTGSNNVTHIYSLLNQQISGHNEIERWELDWGGSYVMTGSSEPDRRQVMYERGSDGSLSLFKLNQQETMRYFGKLDEDEAAASLKASWRWGKRGSKLMFGGEFKNKTRGYDATRFYYNVKGLNGTVENPLETNTFLNQANIENGTITVDRNHQPKDQYDALSRVIGGYLKVDWNITKTLLLQPGLRIENSIQSVDYSTDGGQSKTSKLSCTNIFPALNVRFTFLESQSFRFSASRTVTRPSFVEMAPFLYQESYGSIQIRGNENLKNGYNYNIDLRYEYIDKKSNLLSVTSYVKILEDPIERVQELAGGSAVHSFRNSDRCLAAGLELEGRIQILKCLKASANASFIYTNVKLPEGGGAYTNSNRALQGASPYLVNVDLTYMHKLNDKSDIEVSCLYNLQGPRIHAVGISGLGDVTQKTQHTLNAVMNYNIDKHFTVGVKAENLLNQDMIFEQEVPKQHKDVKVERFGKGISFSLSASYKL